MSSSAAAFISSTRPRLTSPSHRAKPSFLRGLRHVVDCRVRLPAAMPSRPLLFILSRVGGGGPITKFLGLLWSSTDPTTFDGLPVFVLLPILRSRCFFRVSPKFFGVPPTFGVSGLPPPPTFGVPPNFSRSGCHPRSGSLPRSGCHPRSVRRPRSFRHLTTGLSVT